MRKILSMAAVAATLLSASAANAAASLTFDFNEALSSFSVVSTTPGCILPTSGCKISTTLFNPIDNLTVEEGATSDPFAFGQLSVGPGIGGDLDGQVKAILAFVTPAGAGNAESNANVAYATVFGLVSGGFLTWTNPTTNLVAADGSTFSVTFQNLAGVKWGSTVDAKATITVTDVAEKVVATAPVPEPATWALMIGGFGMAGATLRRRRALVA